MSSKQSKIRKRQEAEQRKMRQFDRLEARILCGGNPPGPPPDRTLSLSDALDIDRKIADTLGVARKTFEVVI